MNLECSAQSAVTLLDVVHAAPRLLDTLPPESLKALSATCSFLHTRICTQVTSLTLPISDHLILLQPQRWSSLCVVWITVAADTSGSTCMQSFKTDCAVFAYLTSSSTLDPLTNGKELVLSMPATEHVGSHGLTPCQIHLPAMSQLAEHSKEAKLNCAIVTVLDREEGTLRQFNSMTWPHLSILIICSDSIGSDVFLHLKPDTLPSLTCLLIKASKFDTQAAIHLATGLPHRLSVLQLFTHIDATAAHHLSTANWPWSFVYQQQSVRGA